MSGLGKDEAYQIESRKWDTQGAYKLIVKKKQEEDNPNRKQMSVWYRLKMNKQKNSDIILHQILSWQHRKRKFTVLK